MNIRTRKGKKGTTHQAWYRHRGEFFAKTFDKRSDAKDWLQRETASVRKNPTQSKSGLTLSEFCEQWLPRYKVDVKYCTYDNARLYIGKWLVPNLGDLRMDEITDLDLIDLREKILDAERGPRTANYVMSIVSKLFNDATNPSKQWNLRAGNPVKGIKPLALELKKLPYWEMDEITKFLSEVEKTCPEDFALYSFLLNSGARIGEACALHWDQVELNRNRVEIRRNVDWVRHRIESTTKNHELRVVGIVEELSKDLRKLYLQQGRPNSNQLVFPNSVGKLRTLKSIYRGSFELCIRRARVKAITLHDLRHTFAAQYVMNGGKIYDLKKILGHRDIKMTERYAHLSSEYIQQQTAIIGFSASGAKRTKGRIG